MGKNLFRDGRYCKTVVVGKRTVKAGERAALWSLGGKIREVEGPQRVWMWFTTVRFLDRYEAETLILIGATLPLPWLLLPIWHLEVSIGVV